MQDVSDKLLGQFVACLEQRFSAAPPAGAGGGDAGRPGGSRRGQRTRRRAAPGTGAAGAAAPPSADDALDLGATVLPVLVRSYWKPALAALAGDRAAGLDTCAAAELKFGLSRSGRTPSVRAMKRLVWHRDQPRGASRPSCSPVARLEHRRRRGDRRPRPSPPRSRTTTPTSSSPTNGDIDVVETLTVDFPSGDRHGIFRFFDRADPSAPSARRRPYDVDGHPGRRRGARSSELTRGPRALHDVGPDRRPGRAPRHRRARLRDQVPRSTARSSRARTSHGDSQFYWQLIPSGWPQDIEEAHLTVKLPVPTAEDVQCAVGFGETAGVRGPGRRHRRAHRDHRRAPRTHAGQPIKAGLDLPTPRTGTSPCRGRRASTGCSAPARRCWASCSLLVAGVGLLGIVLARMTYERNPQFPLMYGPPDGIGPAQAKYVLTEGIDKEAYVATLMHAAQHGAVDLHEGPGQLDHHRQGRSRRSGAGWTRSPAASPTCCPGRAPRSSAGKKDVAAGERLKDGDRALRDQHQGLGDGVGQPDQGRSRRARRPARAAGLRRRDRHRHLEPLLDDDGRA